MQKVAQSGLLGNDIDPLATADVTNYHLQEKAPYNVIYHVREGELSLTIDGEAITLNDGDTCFIDKNTDYEIRGTASVMRMKKPLFGSMF